MKNTEKKKLSLPIQLMIALILGIVCGFLLKEKMSYVAFIGTIFIRLLKMCVYPLILFSIISGVSRVASVVQLKKIGGSFFAWVVLTSTLAGLLGSLAVTITGAGKGLILQDTVSEAGTEINMLESFVEWVPENIFGSLASGTLIQIIIFAVFFGAMITMLKGTLPIMETVASLISACDQIMQAMVGIVMKIAPVGVFCLIANLVGTTGVENLRGLATMVGCMAGATLVYLFVVYPILLWVLGRLNPIKFFKNMAPAIMMAFSTQSSAATVPVTMECSKKGNGVADVIVDLCCAPAATINMNGAAIEYTIYTLFAAHAFNVEFTALQIVFMVVLCVVCSIGGAGVPGGGIIMCSICLTTMGLPNAEVTAMVAGVYVLLDICSTTLNVTGDAVGMAIIGARMDMLDRDTFNA